MQIEQEEYPILSRPPINEAILEIVVKLPEGKDFSKLSAYKELINNSFSKVNVLVQLQGDIGTNKVLGPNIHKENIGYIYSNPEERKLIQVRLDGFSFAITNKQYKKWGAFSTEAKKYWDIYQSLLEPTAISRISLRFINEIEIPLPIVDLKDFIKTKPELADGIPSSLESMFMQVNTLDKETDSNIIITETFNPPNDEKLPFIFDIDVQKYRDYLLEDQDRLWSDFLVLRNLKNKVFFKSITAKTLDLLL